MQLKVNPCCSDPFATIETPGSRGPSPGPSPGPSTPKLTPNLSPSVTSPSQFIPSTSPNMISEATNPSTSIYPGPTSDPNQFLSTDLSQTVTPDYTLPSDANLSALAPNPQSDQIMQNALNSLFNNPAQLQRVLAALQSQMPVTIPPDPGPDNTVSKEGMSSPPLLNFRPPIDGRLSPGPMSLLSAASNLSLSSGDDSAALNALAQSSNQLQKSYKDAAEVEADVNTLQGHIDSLIESLGLDPSTIAVLRGEQNQTQQHADDEIVSSTAATTGQTLPPPRLSDANPDFDFDAFYDFDAGGVLGAGTTAFDATVQQNGAEQLGAFLDEVRSVSNESDKTAGSMLDNETPPVDMVDTAAKGGGKKSKKRKSDVAQLGDEMVNPKPKAPRTKKEQ